MTSIGVIGLGAMGSAMSGHLLAAGIEVVGADLDAQRVMAFSAAGGLPSTVEEIGARCRQVITSLPSYAAALDVLGPASRLYGTDEGIVIETSTLAPQEKIDLAAHVANHGWQLVDCPMSGTSQQAVNGDLVAYLSGAQAAMDEVQPTLQHFTRGIHRVGDVGDGSRVKLIANLLVGIHNAAAAEALALADAAGLDLEQVLNAVADGAGASRMLEVRGPLMVEACYLPATMRVSLFLKDLRLIADMRESAGARTPLLDEVTRLYEHAATAGLGEYDTASIFTVLTSRADRRI